MPKAKGYRSERLRRRRRKRLERSQAWLLYLLAGIVAFAAVLGAWYVAERLSKPTPENDTSGYLAALQLTAPPATAPVAGLLVVQDRAGGDPGVYLVPADLLLEGPHGEYVFAGDAMAAGTFGRDLSRVVQARIDAVYMLPVAEIGRWSGGDKLVIKLKRPLTVDLDGTARVFKSGAAVPAADLPQIFAALGSTRIELTTVQVALLREALSAAALRPAAERTALVAPSPSPQRGPALSQIVARITAGSALVDQIPAGNRVAEGQFAFVPAPDEIQALITRRAPSYRAEITVQVLNGSGRVGVGHAVVEQLASLDVNLPAPLNADRFSYKETQIIAGSEGLAVAGEVRAILGRGVVVGGRDLPKGTVEVIVGADFQAPGTEDQP